MAQPDAMKGFLVDHKKPIKAALLLLAVGALAAPPLAVLYYTWTTR